jgi:hypothetical protein
MDIVEITPEILDIGEINTPRLRLTEDSDNDADIEDLIATKPSVNFGSGIELLMNEKNRNEKKASTSIDIDDITNLENELNDLTDSIDNKVFSNIYNTNPENPHNPQNDYNKKEVNFDQNSGANKKSIFGDLFGQNKRDGVNIKPVSQNEDTNQTDGVNLGRSTAEMNENKTWDGYGKFNNVPVNLEKTQKQPELTKEEELREKFKYIRKLEDLERKGISLSKRYNMDSDLQEMIGEYETILAEKERSNSVKFQGKMMMACITGLEFLNNKFDPFDVKLDGWGEQINENIDEYDEIFAELHEKYSSKASMSPELKLLFQLGGSAMMVHMSNTLFKSSMPGMDDIMRQNPELMKQFTQAAVNTMGQSNPGFSGFMNGMFNGDQSSSQSRQTGFGSGANPGFGMPQSVNRDMPPNVNMGPPPGPVETKLPERSHRVPNPMNRPDIMNARGNNEGVSININEGNPLQEERVTRPDMRGPSSTKNADISSLLSGLKTKQINVNDTNKNELSTISIEDLKELASAKMPTKSKRKQKSDKNIVSLEI